MITNGRISPYVLLTRPVDDGEVEVTSPYERINSKRCSLADSAEIKCVLKTDKTNFQHQIKAFPNKLHSLTKTI